MRARRYAQAEWKDEFAALVEVDAKAKDEPEEGAAGGGGGAEGGGSSAVGGCEVCVYVIENKEQHQPYLCRGLKDPNYQKQVWC